MNARQRFLQSLAQRLKRKTPRRRALASRHRRIWCEVLEPRLALAAPVAVNDSYTTIEDTVLAINTPGVLVNDTDSDGDSLTATLVTGPTRGTLTLNANGGFQYLPAPNFGGVDSFTYRARDAALTSNVATATIIVQIVNEGGPVSGEKFFVGVEDTVLNVAAPGVLAGDVDPDGDPLVAILVSPPTYGTLSLNSNGSFTYIPQANYNSSNSAGPDRFTYRASDGSLTGNVTTVNITIAPVNDFPFATNDSYSTAEDTPLSAPFLGVLTNDSDIEFDPLTAVLVAGPARAASFSLNANGTFTYTPALNYNGPDSFTYRARDLSEAASQPATVTINVAAVNDPPVAVADLYMTLQGQALTIATPGVLSNDTDVDGPVLAAAPVTGPAHGTLTLNTDGSFRYAPNSGGSCSSPFVGIDSFTYRVSDGAAQSNLATVTISVPDTTGDPPLPFGIPIALLEDTALMREAPGLLSITVPAGPCAPPGTPPAVITFFGPASLVTPPQRGSMFVNPNGSFTYIPHPNFSGYDNFTFRAFNAQQQEVVPLITMVVEQVNDPPVAVNDTYQTSEDLPLNVGAQGVIANDADIEFNPLTPVNVTQPAHGTVTFNALGGFRYVPAANFNGTDSFTYRANDGSLSSNVATVTITVAAVNDPPVAANNAYTTLEDVPLFVAPAGGVLANDTDVDSTSLTAQLVAGPQYGVLTLQSNGGFTYTPHANFTGAETFTYRASDGLLTSNTATVVISVSPCSCDPIPVNDTYNANEDTTLTVPAPGILANDIVAGSNMLTAHLVTGPTRGVLSLGVTGGFTYTPGAHFFGADSFTYRPSDGVRFFSVATVTINIANIPDPPIAANDSFSLQRDTTLIIAPPGVLANDTDVDGDMLTAQLVIGPARGTLLLNANGAFIYTPNANFSGLDSFTYRARDTFVDGNQATVSLNVVGCNGCIPIAINDAYTAQRNTALNIAAPGVLTNDAHSGGATLTAILFAGPANGTLSLNANGSFRYTPNNNFSGLDSFTYRSSDGTAQSNVATVTISVTQPPNSPPLATNDHFTVLQNTPVTISAPGVLVNDSDADGDPLTAVLVSPPANGTLTLNSNGSFSYTPAVNFMGLVSFAYRASDGISTSNPATVTLTLCACGGPPLASNDSYTVAEDVLLNVPVAAGVLTNDTDFASSTLFAQLATGAARGTLALNPNGSFTYTPNANVNGTDSFTYRANNGQLTSNVATVAIAVTPVNDPPVATPDAYTSLRNTPLTIAAPGVGANDMDVDGDALVAVLVTSPANGALSLGASGGFTYTPILNFTGLDSFSYRVNDGLLNSIPVTVQLHISGPCLAPTCPGDIVDDQYTLLEDVPLVVIAPGVLANDADIDSPPLTAQLVTGPARGTLSLNPNGSFLYTPQPNVNGVDSFTYRAYDGTTYSNVARVTLTVTPVNDPPVATPDRYNLSHCGTGTIGAPGVLGNDTDVDGNTLTAVLVSGPAFGTLTLNSNGSFTYAAAPSFVGQDSFSYRASDGLSSSGPASVVLNISAAPNMPPVAFDDNFTVTRDGLLLVAAPGVLANDNDDCDLARLTAHLVSGPAHGTLTLESSGRFQYTPNTGSNTGFEGTDSFSYRASDGQLLSNSAVVRIAVVSENNQPPTAIPDRYTTPQNIQLSIGGLGILGNDLDPEGRPLTAALVAGPANGTLSLQQFGGFTYMPALNFSGVDSFTYRASDGVATSAIATVTIAVAPPGANTPPVANHDQFYAIEDNAVSVFPGVLANDTDAERNSLTAALADGPAHGTLSLSAAGSFHYQPEANFHGLDRFTYRASDGSLTSEIATVSIFVFNLNDRPVATNDSYTLAENTLLNIAAPGVLANDSDRDGDTLTAALVAGPVHGTLSLAANGAFTYTHAPSFLGSDSFTYRASDGALTSNVATVSIRVGLENVPPSFVKGPDQAAHDESGPQTILNWATQISAGPPSEANQTLTFLVTATNSHLFAVSPQITPDGRLTFTPALMASGTSLVTVRLQDSGGGDNTSPPQTFAITIARLRPLHNVRNPLDTNADGFISPIDAVEVINLVSAFGASLVAEATGGMQVPAGLYPDVDGDNFVSPIDAVLVINALNSRPVAAPAAEGEPPPTADLPEPSAGSIDDDALTSLLTLLANDVAQSTRRRRSR